MTNTVAQAEKSEESRRGSSSSRIWFTENWDKFLFGILALVVSGIVGYYSGIVVVTKELGELRTLATKNDIRINDIKLNADKIPELIAEQTRQKDRIADLERENDNAETIRGIIQIRDDQIKQATVQYLERIIERIQQD